MKPAPDFDDLGGGLAHWQQYDPANKVDLHAHAVRAGNGDGGKLFFIDPIPLRAAALEFLTADVAAPVAGIIVTNANHARAADSFRQRWSALLWIHAAAAAEANLTADHTIPDDGGPICDGAMEAIPLPGAAAGEIALYRADENGGVMIVGDALIYLPSHGFSVLPDKYCTNAKTLRRSLAALLEREFETMLFAHGEPILRGARARLAGLLG